MFKTEILKQFVITLNLIFLPRDNAVTIDPCYATEHKPFTNVYLGSRNEECLPPPTSVPEQCDFFLKRAWYVVDNATLLNTCPSKGNCGVDFPVWMNGTFPGVSDGIVNRTACIKKNGICCKENLHIQVKNCTGYFVYHLKPTKECGSVYCFETLLPCTPPTTTTTTTTTIATTTATSTLPTSVKTLQNNQTKPPSKNNSTSLLIGIAVGVGVILCLGIIGIVFIVKKNGCGYQQHEVKSTCIVSPTAPPYETAKNFNASPPPAYETI